MPGTGEASLFSHLSFFFHCLTDLLSTPSAPPTKCLFPLISSLSFFFPTLGLISWPPVFKELTVPMIAETVPLNQIFESVFYFCSFLDILSDFLQASQAQVFSYKWCLILSCFSHLSNETGILLIAPPKYRLNPSPRLHHIPSAVLVQTRMSSRSAQQPLKSSR